MRRDAEGITTRPTGRPPKLTPELRVALIDVIKVGTPLKTALAFVGLTDDTIYTWRNRAESAKKLAHPSKELQGFVDFFGEVDRAVHEAAISAQRTVHYLFSRDLATLSTEEKRLALQAAQFHLTHRNGSDYNTRMTTELTGSDSGPIRFSGREALELLREISEG